jgi:hypothetical protein
MIYNNFAKNKRSKNFLNISILAMLWKLNYTYIQVRCNAMKTRITTKIIYLAILFLLTIVIWKQLYSAQFLEYDDNYGSLIFAFLVSVFTTIGLTILWFKARPFIKQNSLATLLFLLASSPITICVVFYFYHDLFGQLKN